MSDLDQEFDKMAEKINAKLKEAAEALKEANRLAQEAKLPGLIYTQYVQDDYPEDDEEDVLDDEGSEIADDDRSYTLEEKYEKIDVSDLESELCDGGWSTSSSYC